MSATAISPETTTVSTALTVNGTQRPLQELFPNLFETLVDEDTGEETLEPKIIYIEGRPKIYRFDGKTGRFNLDGKEDLGTEFSFQPFAWRLFSGGLFDRKESTQWVEFFFLDADLCVSTIMFNNTSAINFKEAREKIVYLRKKFEDLKFVLKAEKKDYEITLPDGKTQKGNYFAATFQFEEGDLAFRKLGRDVARAYNVYGVVTLQNTVTTFLSDWFPKHLIYGLPLIEPPKEEVRSEPLPVVEPIPVEEVQIVSKSSSKKSSRK